MSSPPPSFLASRLRHVNGETRPDTLMQCTCYLVDRVIGELAQFSEGVRQAESLWRSLSNHSIRRRALTADRGLKAPMKPAASE